MCYSRLGFELTTFRMQNKHHNHHTFKPDDIQSPVLLVIRFRILFFPATLCTLNIRFAILDHICIVWCEKLKRNQSL
jgi:hypothetical protein